MLSDVTKSGLVRAVCSSSDSPLAVTRAGGRGYDESGGGRCAVERASGLPCTARTGGIAAARS